MTSASLGDSRKAQGKNLKKPRKTGRPKSMDAVSRERILATAARLFSERGYSGTTVRDVAGAAGITAGSLFHHFPSKEQMLVEMLREASMTLCVGAEAVVANVPRPERRLLALIRHELECLAGDKTKYHVAVLISEWRSVPASAKPELKMLRGRYYAVWIDVLDQCHARGALRAPPDAVLKIIHGANRAPDTPFRGKAAYSNEQFAAILVNLVLTEALDI